jgi:GH25 family lysozyme M1 (1,4-beta-N-acetylmuramidase)
MKVLSLLISLSLLIQISPYQVFGIDLSGWDDVVYWDTLKQEVQFVILRAGYGQGKSDAVYESYYQKCKQYGLPVGAYWFAYATTVEGARQEAYYFLEKLEGKQLEYPVYYDIEEQSIFDTGKENVSNMLKEFCTILESKRYYCGVYSSRNYLDNYFTDEVLDRYDIWLAQYASSTSYTRHLIWQFTGTGSLDGKPGDCDLNYCYYDYPTLMKTKHFNGF